MSAKSVLEDWLLAMLWGAEQLMVASSKSFDEPFEGWARRHGLHGRLARMERRKLVRREKRAGKLIFTLTQQGRLAALGGQDALSRWSRPWDGQWRQLLFDLPQHQQKTRMRLWRWLRQNGFGYLQQSVWICPDPVAEISAALDDFRDDVESLIVMEARCCRGYKNEAVVCGAWDFEEINRRHEGYLATATLSASERKRLATSPAELGAWLRRERIAWQHAMAIDPLLPRVLWPKSYRGEAAWQARIRLCRDLAATLS
jgi:phenylacetic acid degradation operon negative regulatory protein